MFPQSDEIVLVRQRNHRSISVMLIASVLLAAGCTDRGNAETAPPCPIPVTNSSAPALPNGVYAVIREADTKTEAAIDGTKHIVLIYDRKNTRGDSTAPPHYVVVDPADYVPLAIDGSPEIVNEPDGKTMLSVTLARENISTLEAFTRAHLGKGKVANVIGGEIITLHKVRAVIPDGKMQITRCEDDACRVIYSKLSPWPPIMDVQGHAHSPFDQQAAKAVVMVFVLGDCPIANSYIPKLNRLNEECAKQGVQLFIVDTDPDATVNQGREHAHAYHITAPLLLDSEHKWIKLSGATKSPEVAVFLPDGRMPYRGRIDDQYVDLGKRRVEPTSLDLEEAIKSVLAGRTVNHPVTEAVGCFIPELPVHRD